MTVPAFNVAMLRTVVAIRQSTPAASAAFQSARSRSYREILNAGAGKLNSTKRRSEKMRAHVMDVEFRRTSGSPRKLRRIACDSGEINSPQTRWRGRRPRSNSTTFLPARAAVIAAAVPAGPPPMIATSCVTSKRLLPFGKGTFDEFRQTALANASTFARDRRACRRAEQRQSNRAVWHGCDTAACRRR